MKATQLLHNLGQSLWLDNITRGLLDSGTLKQYIDELSVRGLTSNPTIFDHAIKNSAAYDAAITEKSGQDKSSEALFFELALEDLTRAADLFQPIHEKTNGVDGWVSLEVSPLLAHDTASTIAAAKDLFARAARPNLLIKIPGTREGLPAIEEANLTHLRESLLEYAPLRIEQVHAMLVESPDLDAAAARYALTLQAIAGSPPVLDLVHLGLGTDGHTASLVPGDPVLDVLNEDVAVTGIYQGRRRMTLTYPILNRSRRVLWLVTGSEKAGMLGRLHAADASIPAGRIRRDQALVLADHAAASKLHSDSTAEVA